MTSAGASGGAASRRPAAVSGPVLSDSRLRYDGQAYGAAPTKGDVTLTEGLKSQTGNSATYLDAAATYDSYGRPLTTTDLGSTSVFDTTGATGPVTTPSTNARTATTTYAPATGRLTKATFTTPPGTAGNTATALTTTTDYDLLRGQATDTIDVNSRRTDVVYDALGRTMKVWLPTRAKINNDPPNTQYAYNVIEGKPTSVATVALNDDNSTLISYTLYDGLGRARQTQSPGDNGGRILTDVFYDERGQTTLAYAPYYTTGAPSSTLSKVEDATGVETQAATLYDGLGRTIKSTVLSGNGVGDPLASTITEYGGDRITVTPLSGATPTTTITNAAGQTIELRQYKASTPIGAYDSTAYGYDPAGHTTRLTDSSGTVWTWQYDQRGNQRAAVDPDTGTSTKTYNDRGETVSSTDGRGKTVTTVYDNLSRVTETHDGPATGPLLTSQTWDPTGGKGKLSTITRYSTVNGTTYQYKTAYTLFDTMARPTRTTVTVPSVPGQESLAGNYSSGVIYRLDGQPRSISYPAAGNLPGESVALTYDTLHRPTAAQGLSTYLTGQTYSLTGKPLQSTLNNGTAGKDVYVTNAYEWGTQRLKSSRTDQYGITGATRAAAYTYDQAGNVTSITDTSRTGIDRQCYQYDYLTRLAEAYTPAASTCPTTPAGAALGGPAPYWTSYTYNTNGARATETDHNPAGNIAQDTTTSYTYPAPTAPQSHSLTGTSTTTGGLGVPVTQSYTYDPSGNTTARHLKPSPGNSSDQVLTWDGEGNLTKVDDTVKTTSGSTVVTTSKTTDYLYGADGGRLLTHNVDTATPASENWTLYLGGTELKLVKGAAKSTATRYYSVGAATAVRTNDNTVTFQVNDHHGTAEANINATTGDFNQRRTTPFGELRDPTPTQWAGGRGFLGGTNEATGLTRLGARDYDPATGRFISADPLLVSGDPQSLNGYSYSNNNPVTLSPDPPVNSRSRAWT